MKSKKRYAQSSIMTRTLLLLFVVFVECGVVSCGKKGEKAVSEPEEDQAAKELLQGIWLNDEDESVVFKAEGDTIFYPDSTSLPVHFKIVADTLVLIGSKTVKYSIVKQAPHLFEFKNPYGDIVKLVKSENTNDKYFFENTRPVALNQGTLIKRDSVIVWNNERYHSYIQVNPTTYKVKKRSYNDEGVEVDNVYYDNIIHVSVYNGASKIFSKDFHKKDFKAYIPEQYYSQCLLSDITLETINDNGFLYFAALPIPDSTTSYIIKIHISFAGKEKMDI